MLRLYAQNPVLAGDPPQTTLGSLQRSPRPIARFQGPYFYGEEMKVGYDGDGKG